MTQGGMPKTFRVRDRASTLAVELSEVRVVITERLSSFDEEKIKASRTNTFPECPESWATVSAGIARQIGAMHAISDRVSEFAGFRASGRARGVDEGIHLTVAGDACESARRYLPHERTGAG